MCHIWSQIAACQREHDAVQNQRESQPQSLNLIIWVIEVFTTLITSEVHLVWLSTSTRFLSTWCWKFSTWLEYCWKLSFSPSWVVGTLFPHKNTFLWWSKKSNLENLSLIFQTVVFKNPTVEASQIKSANITRPLWKKLWSGDWKRVTGLWMWLFFATWPSSDASSNS